MTQSSPRVFERIFTHFPLIGDPALSEGTAELETELADLEALYASAIHSFHTDQLFAKLNECLPYPARPDDRVDVLKTILDAAGAALGVVEGCLFLRNPDTGAYDLVALPTARLQPPNFAPGTSFQIGEGRIGMVASTRSPLRHNHSDEDHNLSDKDRCFNPATERLAQLAVPILAGNDVLGVLSFFCRSPKSQEGDSQPYYGKTQFTTVHLHHAETAASRLSDWIYRLHKARRGEALRELNRAIRHAHTPHEICQALQIALEKGLGRCLTVIRVIDRRQNRDGKTTQALDRYFLSDPSQQDTWPQFLQKGEGPVGVAWADDDLVRVDDTSTNAICQLTPERWKDIGCARGHEQLCKSGVE